MNGPLGRSLPDTKSLRRDAENWLVVLLRPSLTMAFLADDPGSEFTLDGDGYRAFADDIVATFDRLVDPFGRLIGIQVWPVAAHTGSLLRELRTQTYLRVADEGPCFEVHFSGSSVGEVESTGEQSVVGQIYRSDSGAYAVAIDLSVLLLSDADRAAVREAKALWIKLPS